MFALSLCPYPQDAAGWSETQLRHLRLPAPWPPGSDQSRPVRGNPALGLQAPGWFALEEGGGLNCDTPLPAKGGGAFLMAGTLKGLTFAAHVVVASSGRFLLFLEAGGNLAA